MNAINNILDFFTSVEYLAYKGNAQEINLYNGIILSPFTNKLLPFQIKRDYTGNPVTQFHLLDVNGDIELNMDVDLIEIKRFDAYKKNGLNIEQFEMLIYNQNSVTVPEGIYQLFVNDAENQWYSNYFLIKV